MAKRKKPENETPEEARVRTELETIANFATRSEKTSWNRKNTNMSKLLVKLEPFEQQILEAMKNKTPIIDDVTELRKMMVQTCVHPFDHLVHNGDHIVCKFCNKTMVIPHAQESTDS